MSLVGTRPILQDELLKYGCSSGELAYLQVELEEAFIEERCML